MADGIADVCIVGVGGLGGIIAKELASAGLKVVGFERGPAPKKAELFGRKAPRTRTAIARSSARGPRAGQANTRGKSRRTVTVRARTLGACVQRASRSLDGSS